MELLRIWYNADNSQPLLVKFVDSEGVNHEIRLSHKQLQTYRRFQGAVVDKLGIYCQRDDFLRRGGQENWEHEVAGFCGGEREAIEGAII